MSTDQRLDYCAGQVHEFDRDHWLTALFAPEAVRPSLYALYAFNIEISRVPDLVSEPMLGEIRLQWWREVLDALRWGDIRDHPVAQGLAHAMAEGSGGRHIEVMEGLIDARAADLYPVRISDMAELEAYALSTVSPVLATAARLLGAPGNMEGDEDYNLDSLSRAAGLAVAFTGVLRSMAFHGAQDRVYLPGDLLADEGVDVADVIAGHYSPGLGAVICAVAAVARAHVIEARGLWCGMGRGMGRAKQGIAGLPAFLPVALADLYLKPFERVGFDPFKQRRETPVYRRQLRLLRAAFTGNF